MTKELLALIGWCQAHIQVGIIIRAISYLHNDFSQKLYFVEIQLPIPFLPFLCELLRFISLHFFYIVLIMVD